jgi:hypothetical protein
MPEPEATPAATESAAESAARAEYVGRLHREIEKADRDNRKKAILIGEALLEERKKWPKRSPKKDTGWLNWLKTTGIRQQRANEYMAIADAARAAVLLPESGNKSFAEELARARAALKAKKVTRRATSPLPYTGADDDEMGIVEGDFREKGKAIPDGSVALIFTDPPYTKEAVDGGVYARLGRFAARVLRPGGLLVAYVGGLYLPREIADLCKHLEFIQPLNACHHDRPTLIRPSNTWQHSKLLLMFGKPPVKVWWSALNNAIDVGKGEKEHHEWQQPVAEAEYFISRLSQVGDLVVDPFVGSGTTAVAAWRVGRYCRGFEIQKVHADTAKARLAEEREPLVREAWETLRTRLRELPANQLEGLSAWYRHNQKEVQSARRLSVQLAATLAQCPDEEDDFPDEGP